MNLYQSLGYLVLGSRMRRLSEAFLSEINQAYQKRGIDFDAGWFPVFYLLSKNNHLSIKELSEQTDVSHPAASQLITNLKSRDLVTSTTCTDDGRRQLVQLTDKGRVLLAQLLPVWDAILQAMQEMVDDEPGCKALLPAMSAIESAFKEKSLAEKICTKLPTQLKPAPNGQHI